MHFEELVDLLHRDAGTLGNADFALGLKQFGLAALLGRH